jgi:enoyl-CoA hydratase/carnithine racemase
VTLEVAEGIGTITLNRPKMNAISQALQDDLLACAQEATSRADVRAVVLWGGPRVFAAGADIKEMASLDAAQMAHWAGRLGEALDAVAAIPKPVVAAITGFALGGGCELALCADYRISADNAKLGQPEMLLGVIPGAGGTQRLTRLIGPSKAKDLVFSGRFVEADEALALGLVDRLVPAEEVYDAAVAWARPFATGPAKALAAAKACIDRGLDGTLADGLALERAAFADLFDTEDQKAGMASFIEHGPGKAQFTGS